MNFVLLKAVIMQKYGWVFLVLIFFFLCPLRNIAAFEEAALLYRENSAGLMT